MYRQAVTSRAYSEFLRPMLYLPLYDIMLYIHVPVMGCAGDFCTRSVPRRLDSAFNPTSYLCCGIASKVAIQRYRREPRDLSLISSCVRERILKRNVKEDDRMLAMNVFRRVYEKWLCDSRRWRKRDSTDSGRRLQQLSPRRDRRNSSGRRPKVGKVSLPVRFYPLQAILQTSIHHAARTAHHTEPYQQ